MTQLFGIPLDRLTTILTIITLVIVGLVALLALGNLIFFKIGVRNIPRRRTQMWLIVFALMLSTTLLSSVLATGDVIIGAVQSVAVYNLGSVDETIQGGHGALGYFPDGVYYHIVGLTNTDHDIAAVGAALVENDLLVADETSRQVRSKVTALAVIPGSEQGFGGMQVDNGKRRLTIAALGTNDVYLNHTTAQLLNAHAGDMLYVYSKRWPGVRYQMHVVAIVADGGLVGSTPYILSNIQTFRDIENRYDDITEIFVANRDKGDSSDAALSDRVTGKLRRWLPIDEQVNQVKNQGVQNSQKAEDLFSRVFTLFSLFALAIGLLLIFLIFVLLAAERRAEMGMARAIGVQRRHLVLMFLFEGTVYDLLASFVGLGTGIGVGASLVYFLGPTLQRFNFPLKLTFQPHSLIIAYCLGVIFTFCSVAISSWLVSRMTVVEAMRDQPEPGQEAMSLGEICLRLLGLLKNIGAALGTRLSRRDPIYRVPRGVEGQRGSLPPRPVGRDKSGPYKIGRLLGQIPDTLIALLGSLILLGFLPLLAGYWLMQKGLENTQIVFFSLGLSLIALGGGLLIKAAIEYVIRLIWRARYSRHARNIAGKIFATVAGLTLVAYWGLPFDALAHLGLPRFYGGIEIFFLAAFMMVLGAVWVLIANAELIVKPLLALFSRLPRLYALARLASAYPLHRRFRTGLSVVMFSLVVFAMTVMAIITNAMQNTYANINTQTGGYDIQAVAYFKPLPDLRSALLQHGINPNVFSAIGVSTSTAIGVIQPSSDRPGWRIYPAQIVNGGFLQGYGVHLLARAKGFASDQAVWQALQTHPNYALIDSNALPYRPDSVLNSPVYDPNSPLPADAGAPVHPPGFNSPYTFSMAGVYQGDTSFPATPIWVTGTQPPSPFVSPSPYGYPSNNKSAFKLTIIGVVDNSDSAHFGLYIPRAAISGYDPRPSTPDAETYYFKVAPGQDKRALALALGSAFLDNGLETTVLEDAIWQIRGPRIFLSNVLLGVVGLTLLLGVTALAITGTRAVIERRQQIGMLRALGCNRRLIQGAFLFESFLVGAIGSILGVVLGLILSSNIFAVDFFEQFNTGLIYSVPWEELGLIVGIALLAAFLGALLPAWQAGRVTPAEAIRYQ
ncbi:MAG: ABC transporter permease [Ktedonobacteraceae bacterium]